MAVLPTTKLEQIEFCETHLPIWAVAPTSIGLTAGKVTVFTELVETARASYESALAARTAAKAATTIFTGDTGVMRDMAADLIRDIKAYADAQENPSKVYGDAQIPMPAAPTPATAPGKPDAVLVTLESSGAVNISWEAVNASASSGGFFNVSRKLPGQATFTHFTSAAGTTATLRRMSFTDFSIPTSAAGQGAQYIITGQRGILHGTPSDTVIVQFGLEGAGTSVSGAELKMAA